MLTVTHEYFGLSDYWCGNGKRWKDNAGCLFAFVDSQTTLRDCIDQWVDDFNVGGDCDTFPESVQSGDIRKALIDSLTPKGKSDYANNALCEYAEDLVADNPSDEVCPVWIVLVEYTDD